MRILVIRGMNLASLAGEFEVDFRADPLASAGVFAISGPTGAGKSTLLDALCLALYHETPRLKDAREQNVTIPDGAGSVSPNDPRSVLRRGTGHGYAEVEFLGNDGRHWRARWSVARAHQKASTNLQTAKASLVDATENTPVNGTISELRARIAQEIGLSFSQFCRAVLLAQNDFAALLKAKQNERADLLEALTGTELFAQISQLAHARAAQEKQALLTLEQQLAADRPLPPEDRDALMEQLGALEQERDQLGERLTALKVELDWHAEGTTLQTRAEAAARAQADAATALAAADDERRALIRWHDAIQLRPSVDTRRQALREIAAADAALPSLTEARAAADTALDEATHSLAERDAELAQHAAGLAAAAPAIKAARELDARIREAVARQQERQREHASTTQQRARNAAELKDCEDALAQGQRVIDAWHAWRDGHPLLAVADPDWPALGIALRASAACTRERDAALAGLADLERTLVALRQQDDVFAGAVTLATEARHAASIVVEHAKAALDRFDVQALEARADRHAQRCIDAEQAKAAAAQLRDANAVLERAHQAEFVLAGELDSLAGAMQSSITAADMARHEQHAAELTLERTHLAADEHTQRLRELLVDGDPCAVCGATDHPAAHQPVAAVTALLDSLRRTATQARDTCEAKAAAREQTQARHAAAITQLTTARSDHAAAATRVASARDALARRWHALYPGQPASASEQWIDALPGETAAEAAAIKAERAHSSALQAAHDASRRQHDATEQSVRIKQANLEAHRHTALRPAEAAQVRNSARVEQYDRQLADVRAQLRELGRGADHAGQTDSADIVVLLAQWVAGDPIRTAAHQAATASATLREQFEGLGSASRLLIQRIADLDAASVAANAALAAMHVERVSVLAHPDVDAHAMWLESAVRQARDTRDAAATVCQTGREAATAAAAAIEHRLASRAAAIARAEALTATLVAEMAQRPGLALAAGDLDGLAMLVDTLPADLIARQQHMRTLEQNEREASGLQTLLVQQREQWTLAAGSAQSVDAVRIAIDTLGSERDAVVGTLRLRIEEQQRDDARRIAAADRLDAIDTARTAARRWLTLDALIGSADGGKFKRLAQQYTLEVLLEYANEHLHRLSPRYRLARGSEALSLLIVDGDMGDQLRGVHSLSGGETFLVSLALALGLASLSSQRVRVESLFIDEGFGSLDADTLGTAMEALDRLQAEGRRVGVISHVHDMAERIGVQVRVQPTAPGRSVLSVVG